MDYPYYPKSQGVIFSVFLKIHRVLTFGFLYPHTIINNPKGAFYAFPKIENNPFKSDKEFVLNLLKSKGVLAVHGSGFGT